MNRTSRTKKGKFVRPQRVINLPSSMPCPFFSPSGLEGVTQSISTSLRSTLSISTELKNATD